MRLDRLSIGTKLKVPETNWASQLDKLPYSNLWYGTSFLLCIWVSNDWLNYLGGVGLPRGG
jgi:hypothetical protein